MNRIRGYSGRVLALSCVLVGAMSLPKPMLAQGPTWVSCGSGWCTSSRLEMTASGGNQLLLDVEGGFLQIGDRGDSWGGQIRMTDGPSDWYLILEKAAGKFHLYQNINASGTPVAVDRFVVDNGGNFGIGTSSPSQKLEVAGGVALDDRGDNCCTALYMFDGNYQTHFYNYASGPFEIHRYAINGATGVNGPVLTIQPSGNIGIGTTNPQSLLAVNGTITTKEVVVTTTGWSDYVFAPDYHLAPLSEVAAYVKENHHLPDIPSEAEIKEKGVSVGEIESKLLAKIEELTLHMIKADEKNSELVEKNRELQDRISKLENARSTTTEKAGRP